MPYYSPIDGHGLLPVDSLTYNHLQILEEITLRHDRPDKA